MVCWPRRNAVNRNGSRGLLCGGSSLAARRFPNVGEQSRAYDRARAPRISDGGSCRMHEMRFKPSRKMQYGGRSARGQMGLAA